MTRRAWQLLIAAGLIVLMMSSRYYPLAPRLGWCLGGCVFTTVLGLTLLREERRASHALNSNRVINWNLAEALVLLLSTLSGYVAAWLARLPDMYFYAYLHTGVLGLVTGVAFGEWLWQHVRLKELDDTCRNRYWAGYKNSML